MYNSTTILALATRRGAVQRIIPNQNAFANRLAVGLQHGLGRLHRVNLQRARIFINCGSSICVPLIIFDVINVFVTLVSVLLSRSSMNSYQMVVVSGSSVSKRLKICPSLYVLQLHQLIEHLHGRLFDFQPAQNVSVIDWYYHIADIADYLVELDLAQRWSDFVGNVGNYSCFESAHWVFIISRTALYWRRCTN